MSFSRERLSEGFFTKMRWGIYLTSSHLHILHLHILHLHTLHLHFLHLLSVSLSLCLSVSLSLCLSVSLSLCLSVSLSLFLSFSLSLYLSLSLSLHPLYLLFFSLHFLFPLSLSLIFLSYFLFLKAGVGADESQYANLWNEMMVGGQLWLSRFRKLLQECDFSSIAQRFAENKGRASKTGATCVYKRFL